MRHNLADELKQTQEDIPHQRKMKIAATIWADESRISHRITPTSQKNNQATENQNQNRKTAALDTKTKPTPHPTRLGKWLFVQKAKVAQIERRNLHTWNIEKRYHIPIHRQT